MEKINLEKLVLCRSLICTNCQKEGRPNGSEEILLYSKHTKNFKILRPESYEVILNESKEAQVGYTPHLLSNGRESDGNYLFDTMCLVNGCGVLIRKNMISSYEEMLDIENILQKNIIDFQNLLIPLQRILLKKHKLTLSERKSRKEILENINSTIYLNNQILHNNFTPEEHSILYLNIISKEFTPKLFIKLINNDKKFFKQNYVLKNNIKPNAS